MGTIRDEKEKNHTWFVDFVFGKGGRNETYLSILVRSTRFFMAAKLDRRLHEGVVSCLRDDFARLGRPKRIVCDREFISKALKDFLTGQNIDLCPLPRESPFLNMVERYHQELKKIAQRSNISLKESVDILNNLPFPSTPSGVKFKKISPAHLFFNNDQKALEAVCNFFENESRKRQTRSENLRGKNILRFQNKFNIEDIVRFNIGHTIGFGKIVEAKSKIYEVKRIDGSGQTSIHAHQMELVTISEDFLKLMLSNT